MKIYIVYVDEGEYGGDHPHIDKAFFNRDRAEEYVEEMTISLEKQTDFYCSMLDAVDEKYKAEIEQDGEIRTKAYKFLVPKPLFPQSYWSKEAVEDQRKGHELLQEAAELIKPYWEERRNIEENHCPPYDSDSDITIVEVEIK